jgi:2,5-diamino-6-(ribosylamino)-4(3H)-pyrimidinone 5'-phosphate reductase
MSARSQSRAARPALPFVLVNMAMTADGKIATANRAVSSFGSPRDQAHMYELRATADAVMDGARTVDLGPVLLGPGGPAYQRRRLRNGLAEYNLRIIVSGSGSVSPDAAIFKKRFSPIILLTTKRGVRGKLKQLQALADEVRICGATRINFHAALAWLRAKWGVKRLLCEGGGELNAALFEADLVDELNLTICPKIFGGQRAPTIADGGGFNSLAAARRLSVKSIRRVGDELFVVLRRNRRSG